MDHREHRLQISAEDRATGQSAMAAGIDSCGRSLATGMASRTLSRRRTPLRVPLAVSIENLRKRLAVVASGTNLYLKSRKLCF